MTTSRISAGVPTGGQYAATDHPEAEVALDAPENDWPSTPVDAEQSAMDDAAGNAARQDADAAIREQEDTARYGTDQDRMPMLARNEHPWVRAAQAENPATPDYLMRRLSEDSAPIVRLAAATHSTDRNTLDVLREDSSPRIAEQATKSYDRATRKAAAEKKQFGETTVHVGSRTPWGTADDVVKVAPGIASVGTPSHGGLKLSPERNKQVNPAWRRSGGWYEEDCEAGIVMVSFPDAFPADPEGLADKSAKNWYPDEYEQVTGKTVTPGESLTRDRQLFEVAHAADYVVFSAQTSDKDPGMVEVAARTGGHGSGRPEERRRFLVPREDYRADGNRFGFVIDPARHAEMT